MSALDYLAMIYFLYINKKIQSENREHAELCISCSQRPPDPLALLKALSCHVHAYPRADRRTERDNTYKASEDVTLQGRRSVGHIPFFNLPHTKIDPALREVVIEKLA